MSGIRTSQITVIAGVLALAACSDPDFRVHVTFPEAAGIDVGARVEYSGVSVGEVETISLLQVVPEEPALFQLTLRIAGDISLRRDDRFHIATAGTPDAPYVRITPSRDPSPPLEPGATVAGVPPMTTRFEDSLEGAVGALAGLVSEAARIALEELDASIRPGARATAPPLEDEAEVVVVLHGRPSRGGSLQRLADRLREAGFRSHDVETPSKRGDPEELVARLADEVAACCAGAPRLHFVTDSTSGTLLLGYLAERPPEKLGRVVLLGTASGNLADPLPPPDVEVGVIANDDSAAVGSAVPQGMTDIVIVPHASGMDSEVVAEQAIRFLREGRFRSRP